MWEAFSRCGKHSGFFNTVSDCFQISLFLAAIFLINCFSSGMSDSEIEFFFVLLAGTLSRRDMNFQNDFHHLGLKEIHNPSFLSFELWTPPFGLRSQELLSVSSLWFLHTTYLVSLVLVISASETRSSLASQPFYQNISVFDSVCFSSPGRVGLPGSEECNSNT